MSWPRQVHGAAVVRGGGRGAEADAIWTDMPREPVMVVTADCLSVALVRLGGRPAVALAHVGWRGLLAGVVDATVAALGSRQVAAAVGPGIAAVLLREGRGRVRPGAGGVRSRFLDRWAARPGGGSSRRYGTPGASGRPSRRVHFVPSRALFLPSPRRGLTGSAGNHRLCHLKRSRDRYERVCTEVGPGVTVIAATKYVPLAKMGVLAEATSRSWERTARRTS